MEGRGKQQNSANWPTKFGKIYRKKLWALVMRTIFVAIPIAAALAEILLQSLINQTNVYTFRTWAHSIATVTIPRQRRAVIASRKQS